MHADAGEPHQAEQEETRGDRAFGKLRRHQRGKIERDLAVELALAVLPLAEGGRKLEGAQPAARCRQDIE